MDRAFWILRFPNCESMRVIVFFFLFFFFFWNLFLEDGCKGNFAKFISPVGMRCEQIQSMSLHFGISHVRCKIWPRRADSDRGLIVARLDHELTGWRCSPGPSGTWRRYHRRLPRCPCRHRSWCRRGISRRCGSARRWRSRLSISPAPPSWLSAAALRLHLPAPAPIKYLISFYLYSMWNRQ